MIVNARYIVTFDKTKETEAIEQFKIANLFHGDTWTLENSNLAVSFRKEETYYLECDEEGKIKNA